MKSTRNIIKIYFTLAILFIGQNLFGQTPKEIDIALKFAPVFDIKICDSYTLSYFIKKEMDGNPFCNNGLLAQNTKRGTSNRNSQLLSNQPTEKY